MRLRTKIIILSLGFLVNICIVMYPYIATVYNDYAMSLIADSYETSVSGTEVSYDEMLEAASAWNTELYTTVNESYFSDDLTQDEIYESLLNTDGDGLMGYIEIPKIDVTLPIYHYTTDEVLEKGAGHMETSALPVGGESTHCVITAHRGLPTATMFTDLDQLEEGDVFYLKILDQTLAYEVFEIKEVTTEETESYKMRDGEDLCTLVTCTPYGVNTMRLLVTGKRIENTEEAATDGTGTAAIDLTNKTVLPAIAGAELILFILLIVFLCRRNNRQKIKQDAEFSCKGGTSGGG